MENARQCGAETRILQHFFQNRMYVHDSSESQFYSIKRMLEEDDDDDLSSEDAQHHFFCGKEVVEMVNPLYLRVFSFNPMRSFY